MRKRLIDDNILKQEDGMLVFQTDHIFNSPSAAAGTILARRANGWSAWKNKSGVTINELLRK